MPFKEHLKRALDEVPGAMLCTLMGNDGIAIDTVETDGAAEQDLVTATIELTGLLAQVRQSVAGLKTGELRELTVTGHDLTAVVRPVTDEYFLAVVLADSGWAGKARYLLRVLTPHMVTELA